MPNEQKLGLFRNGDEDEDEDDQEQQETGG
jgi:hypothetical protein